MNDKQWVCVVCGYNMIGTMPEVCPFCGAHHDQFVDWKEAKRTYRVTPTLVNRYVTQLISVPRLGIEHAAYRVETDNGAVWIDCPSALNDDLDPVQAILFTHKDFMGASNQYRMLWNAKVYLHSLDAESPLARPFPVDHPFTKDFEAYGIEAYHIGGHSPGWTLYIYREVLFACDYAYPPGSNMRLNPYGPQRETRERGNRILEVIYSRELKTVCGYNYVAEFAEWRDDFNRALHRMSNREKHS